MPAGGHAAHDLGERVLVLGHGVVEQRDRRLDGALRPVFAVEDEAHLDAHAIDRLRLNADEGTVVATAS